MYAERSRNEWRMQGQAIAREFRWTSRLGSRGRRGLDRLPKCTCIGTGIFTSPIGATAVLHAGLDSTRSYSSSRRALPVRWWLPSPTGNEHVGRGRVFRHDDYALLLDGRGLPHQGRHRAAQSIAAAGSRRNDGGDRPADRGGRSSLTPLETPTRVMRESLPSRSSLEARDSRRGSLASPCCTLRATPRTPT